MKILIIGESNPLSLEKIYKKNFKLLKINTVNICTYWKPKNFFLKKLINFTELYFYFVYSIIQNFLLKKKLKNNFIHYDLTIVFNGYYMNRQIIKYIKKEKSRKIINIQTDNIFFKKNVLLKDINFFDRIYVWSKYIRKEIVQNCNINEDKVLFLPFGYDQFHNLNKKIKINDKIFFYGAWDKNRENFLSKMDCRILKICGNQWENAKISFKKKFDINKSLKGKSLAKEVSKSLLCINLFRDQAKNFINMRTFEVMGYGGNLLSEYSKEQSEFFKNYSHLYYFKDIKEIDNIYKKILLKKKQLHKARQKNKLKIKKHDYLHRAKFILSNEKIFINK